MAPAGRRCAPVRRSLGAACLAALLPDPAQGKIECPGAVDVKGYGKVEIVPTGWATDGTGDMLVNTTHVVPNMATRMYFAETCTAGRYDHREYTASKLLGKVLSFTTDLTGVGCGCNAAFYLTSMAQNKKKSDCSDYYCDANNVCNERCAEIDIMEANQFAFHSTLHAAADGDGAAAGFGGGGTGWSGPRDFTKEEYGPGGKCIDTKMPFRVEASFPVDEAGVLRAMQVTLRQEGSSCPLAARIDSYKGMHEMSKALKVGMTPIISYWADDDMLWMDGKGEDLEGPCTKDAKAKCADSVKLYDFALAPLEDSEESELEGIWHREEEERARRTTTSTLQPTTTTTTAKPSQQQHKQRKHDQSWEAPWAQPWDTTPSDSTRLPALMDGDASISTADHGPATREFSVVVKRRGFEHMGLKLSRSKDKTILKIREVQAGPFQRWNLNNPGNEVRPGDLITEANDAKFDADKMLEELSTSDRIIVRLERQNQQEAQPSEEQPEELSDIESKELAVFATPPEEADTGSGSQSALHWLPVNRGPESAPSSKEARAAQRYAEYMRKYSGTGGVAGRPGGRALPTPTSIGVCGAAAAAGVLLAALVRRRRSAPAIQPVLQPSPSTAQLLSLL